MGAIRLVRLKPGYALFDAVQIEQWCEPPEVAAFLSARRSLGQINDEIWKHMESMLHAFLKDGRCLEPEYAASVNFAYEEAYLNCEEQILSALRDGIIVAQGMDRRDAPKLVDIPRQYWVYDKFRPTRDGDDWEFPIPVPPARYVYLKFRRAGAEATPANSPTEPDVDIGSGPAIESKPELKRRHVMRLFNAERARFKTGTLQAAAREIAKDVPCDESYPKMLIREALKKEGTSVDEFFERSANLDLQVKNLGE